MARETILVLDGSASTPVHGAFATTHWSEVLRAGQGKDTEAAGALERLCRAYWQPLYVYVRRQGRSVEEAQDLTQDFFARLLSKDYLRLADPNRGRFRTFLLTALKGFVINDWVKRGAARRGGGKPMISLDEFDAEELPLLEPAHYSTPEQEYEKRWAVALLQQVLDRLAAKYAAEGKAQLFERLKQLLWGDKGSPPYSVVASELGLSEGAVRVAVHRLRQRYCELLRSEVADTLTEAEDVDDELRHLLAVISA